MIELGRARVIWQKHQRFLPSWHLRISELWLKLFNPLGLHIKWWNHSHRKMSVSSGWASSWASRRAWQGHSFSLFHLDADSFLVSKVSLLRMLSVGGQPTLKLLRIFCRLLEALVSFLKFSDKKANSAMGLLIDLALEER